MNSNQGDQFGLEQFFVAMVSAITKGEAAMKQLAGTVRRVDTGGLTANGPEVLQAHSEFAAAARELKWLVREMERMAKAAQL